MGSLPRSDFCHVSVAQHQVAAAAHTVSWQQQELQAMCIPQPDAPHMNSTSRLMLLLLLPLPPSPAAHPQRKAQA